VWQRGIQPTARKPIDKNTFDHRIAQQRGDWSQLRQHSITTKFRSPSNRKTRKKISLPLHSARLQAHGSPILACSDHSQAMGSLVTLALLLFRSQSLLFKVFNTLHRSGLGVL